VTAATFEIEENSVGWQGIQRMLRSLRAGESYVKAGVTGAAASEQHDAEDDAPLTNVDLAVIHEFGAPSRNIPPRPAINGTFALHRDEYIKRLRDLMPKVYEQRITITFMLEVVGQQMASDMRNRISSGEPPFAPNAPSTLARKLAKGTWNRKGKAQAAGQQPMPLLDTGRFRNSITHEVVITEGT
jgi:hypothetical protein